MPKTMWLLVNRFVDISYVEYKYVVALDRLIYNLLINNKLLEIWPYPDVYT